MHVLALLATTLFVQLALQETSANDGLDFLDGQPKGEWNEIILFTNKVMFIVENDREIIY